jgi:hypothetical protein
MRLAPLLAIVIHLVTVDAIAQTATFARSDYPFLGNDHIVVDVDRDGRADLVATGINSVRVMLGNGDGTFRPRVEFPVSASAQPQAVAAGDFNRDGVPDIIVTLNDAQIGFALITGRGDGTFNPPAHFPNVTGSDGPAIAAVDLDNDGNLDVVAGHGIACFQAPCVGARFITVMRGRGDGSFDAARAIDVGSDTAAIGVGDFNRDSVRDLVLASSASRVHVLLGTGGGTFTQQTLTLVPENNLGMDNTDIDVADINNDLIDDVVVAMSLNGSKTVILIGNGDGTFRNPQFIQEPAIRIPQYQAIADYNGDGRLDLALSLAWGSQGLMEIRNGNGDGTFGPVVLYFAPPDKSSIGGWKIQSADFNGDGKADIALGWAGASTGLAVLRNTTGTVAPPPLAAPSLVSPANDAIVAQPVTLDWADVANAVSYEVQVDNSSTIASPFVANATVTASQVTLSGLPAQRLWWRVRARNSAGVFGPFSSVRRFTPQSGAPAPVSLASLSFSPTSVTGGTTSVGTVTLTAAAPSGAAVTLASSQTATVSVPTSIAVPAGATTAKFTATTSAVSTSTSVTVSAAYAGVAKSATLTVNPPGQSATLTVTAAGRSGERVLSSPSGISVAVGTTGSATFNAGTSITLSVTNGRDAIWSGACSSGGEKRRTCTFTLNGNAALTANVQ